MPNFVTLLCNFNKNIEMYAVLMCLYNESVSRGGFFGSDFKKKQKKTLSSEFTLLNNSKHCIYHKRRYTLIYLHFIKKTQIVHYFYIVHYYFLV